MWIEYFQKNHFLKSLYKDSPNIESVRIASFSLEDDGLAASIIFDVKGLPNSLPKKWEGRGYNTIQLELKFVDLKKVTTSIDITKDVSNITFTQTDGLVMKTVGHFNIDLHSDIAYVSNVTAYQDGQE